MYESFMLKMVVNIITMCLNGLMKMVAVHYSHYKSGAATYYRHVILTQPQCGVPTSPPTFVCHTAFVVW